MKHQNRDPSPVIGSHHHSPLGNHVVSNQAVHVGASNSPPLASHHLMTNANHPTPHHPLHAQHGHPMMQDNNQSFDIQRRGMLLVLSSPSGAGKTTLSRRLLEYDHEITMSVSVTTRPRRPSEISGRDYDFVSVERFEKMKKNNIFLETAFVHGNHYGTPSEPVLHAIESGIDMLFDIDWQGTKEIKAAMPNDVVTIFILPPSIDELAERLHGRAQDSEQVIEDRLAAAWTEITHWNKYDYVVVNADIEICLHEIQSILVAERSRRQRQTGMADFVRDKLGAGISPDNEN